MKKILDILKEKILICDGAIGTMLYAKGIDPRRCYEHLVVEQPLLIEALHREYVDAGADIIETHTFGANRVQLAKYGHEGLVFQINTVAARLARNAAEGRAFVAGSVGPLPFSGGDRVFAEAEITAIYKEQILALAEGGVDFFILETFSHLDHLKMAVAVCKKETSLPVVAQMAFLDGFRTSFGHSIEAMADVLGQAGADVVGVNCGSGPGQAVKAVAALARLTDAYISAQPNAGYPQMIDGRTMYMTSPVYFSVVARDLAAQGANIIGGCCGTTPEHIRAAAQALISRAPIRRKSRSLPLASRAVQKDGFFEKEARSKTRVIVELLPPRNADTEKFIDTAFLLKNSGASHLSFPENPLAQVRMSSIAAAGLVKQKTGMEAIFHYTCRDRNLIGLQSDVLGAYALGLRAVLAVTGDPVALGKTSEATPVFDLHSIKLVQLLDNMRRAFGLSLSIGVAFNPNGDNMTGQIERLRQKIGAGADFVMTQPLFEKDKILEAFEKTKFLGVPVFWGILPLVSRRNAEFLHNEVPGMKIPEDIRERVDIQDKEKAAQEGVNIALELIRATQHVADGYYLISPLRRYELSARILEQVSERLS